MTKNEKRLNKSSKRSQERAPAVTLSLLGVRATAAKVAATATAPQAMTGGRSWRRAHNATLSHPIGPDDSSSTLKEPQNRVIGQCQQSRVSGRD